MSTREIPKQDTGVAETEGRMCCGSSSLGEGESGKGVGKPQS